MSDMHVKLHVALYYVHTPRVVDCNNIVLSYLHTLQGSDDAEQELLDNTCRDNCGADEQQNGQDGLCFIITTAIYHCKNVMVILTQNVVNSVACVFTYSCK